MKQNKNSEHVKSKGPLLRVLAPVLILVLAGIGLAVHTGTGTPSAWGIYDIAAICPLGAVEAFLASKTFVPPLFIGLAIVVVFVLIFGRAFCAWGCPVPLLRKVFGIKGDRESRLWRKRNQAKEDGSSASRDVDAGCEDLDRESIKESKYRGGVHDSRNWVLGGTVLTTAAFGFPVFCLICPVGLTFATLIAVWRLFQFSETTLSLLVFPAILVVEIVFLRKWCHKFCPLGALLSLISRANKTFRPTVDSSVCLHEKGEHCHRCVSVCPEGVNLHDKVASAPLSECTKCHVCAEKCPVHAISFPILPKKTDNGD